MSCFEDCIYYAECEHRNPNLCGVAPPGDEQMTMLLMWRDRDEELAALEMLTYSCDCESPCRECKGNGSECSMDPAECGHAVLPSSDKFCKLNTLQK